MEELQLHTFKPGIVTHIQQAFKAAPIKGHTRNGDDIRNIQEDGETSRDQQAV